MTHIAPCGSSIAYSSGSYIWRMCKWNSLLKLKSLDIGVCINGIAIQGFKEFDRILGVSQNGQLIFEYENNILYYQ